MTRIATFFLLIFSVAGLYGQEGSVPDTPTQARSDVFWVHDTGASVRLIPAQTVIRRMVDALVMAATGQGTSRAAWRSLVSPGERVGIKVMTTGGPVFNTHPELVTAIVDGLVDAGISRGDLLVWDRSAVALEQAGFTAKRVGCRVVAGERKWDSKQFFTSHISGQLIWGDLKFAPRKGAFSGGDIDPDMFSSASHFTTVLSQQVDKVINVPLFTTSKACGLAGALYNMTVPNVDNSRRLGGRPSFGNPDIAMMYAHELVRNKVVLTILDGLVAQYAGGPGFEPNYAFEQRTLYASKDPVALDLVAVDQIERWRVMANLPPLGDATGHVKTAGEIGLGAANLDAVNRKQVTR